MADIRRELSALQTLLADNTSGDVSPQDARDVLVSESPSFIHPTSAAASPPSTPVTGDLWLPTDGFVINRYSGSAWVPWGPIFPLTDPALQTLTWINQGSATISTTNGGVVMSATSNGAADNWRIRKKTAPATPYTITAAFLPLADLTSTAQVDFALLFRQSSDGKLHTVQMSRVSASNLSLYILKYTDASTFSGIYFSQQQSLWPMQPLWLQISDDGTNRICRVSCDGQNWAVVHTVGRTDFLTANEVGWAVNPIGAACNLTLLSWKES